MDSWHERQTKAVCRYKHAGLRALEGRAASCRPRSPNLQPRSWERGAALQPRGATQRERLNTERDAGHLQQAPAMRATRQHGGACTYTPALSMSTPRLVQKVDTGSPCKGQVRWNSFWGRTEEHHWSVISGTTQRTEQMCAHSVCRSATTITWLRPPKLKTTLHRVS